MDMQPQSQSQVTAEAGKQQGRHQWAFHVIGSILCIGATVAAGIAAVVVSFGTSVCNDVDTSDELRELRIGLLIIGVLLTLVPSVLTGLAAKLRFVWLPWACVAGLALLVTLFAASQAQVGTWCF